MTDDRSREGRDTGTTHVWLRRQASSLGGQVVGAFVTTVSLSLGYMIFNDHVAPPPDLSGDWKFTVVYEETQPSGVAFNYPHCRLAGLLRGQCR